MSLILSGTNGLSDVDGTAAAPAIRGTDSNTGIFFPAADTIAFAEGGAEVARFDSSGNLGIGTTAGNAKLSVQTGSTYGVIVGTSSGSAGTTLISFGNYLSQAGGSNGSSAVGGVHNHGSTSLSSLAFYTHNGTSLGEVGRFDSSGNLLVGTTTSIAKLFVQADGDVAVPMRNNNTAAGTGSNNSMIFQRSGTNTGTIAVTGSATAYNTSSDYRLKNTIAPMTGALAKVIALKPCTYKWKVDGSDGQGFIAHELDEVVPGCVTGEKDAVGEEQYEVTPAVKDEDGNTVTEAVMGTRIAPVYQGIDTSFLVATLTAAIQELKAIVDTQAARITALEAA